jgi:opacity protein-like surface antigen
MNGFHFGILSSSRVLLLAITGVLTPLTLRAQDDPTLGDWSKAGTWIATAEAQALARDTVPTMPFSGIDADFDGEAEIVQATDDLAFDYSVGTRLELGRWISETSTLQFVYFGLESFSSHSERVDAPGRLLSPYSGFNSFSFGSIVGFDDAQRHELDYSSEIHNVELNLQRHAVSETNWGGGLLGGFRLVTIDEDFWFRSYAPGTGPDGIDTFGTARNQTSNVLLMGQVGADVDYAVTDRMKLNGALRAGVGCNLGESRGLFEQSIVLINRTEYGGTNQSVCTLIEGGVGLEYALTERWSLRGGYSVMILSGLLLAPEQFDIAAGYNGLQLDDTGLSVYHGATLGATCQW